MAAESFTGRARGRQTPKSVRTAERVARFCISAGGVGTIVAVTLILAFLLWVAFPLLSGASLEERVASESGGRRDVLAAGLDEYRRIGWTLGRDGRIAIFRADDGTRLGDARLFGEADAPTAWSFPAGETEFAFGYRDGTIRTGRVGFALKILAGDAVPAELKGLAKGHVARLGDGIAEGLGEGRVSVRTLAASLDEPVPAATAAIHLLDVSVFRKEDEVVGHAFATLSADGGLAVQTESVRENMLTGEKVKSLTTAELPYGAHPGRAPPAHVLLSAVGNGVCVVWRDGFLERYDATDPAKPRLAETARLVEPGVEVTAFGSLAGKTTMVVGDTRGHVNAWFVIKPEGAGTVDGGILVRGHGLEGNAARVTAFGASARARLLAVGYDDGQVLVFFVTGERVLASAPPRAGAVSAVAFAPKQDGVLVAGAGGLRIYDFDAKYPEAAPSQLLGEVWYEGYPAPERAWQSTGGTDAEPKLGIWPLVFGTLKGTLYSILIAAPIALLAAVYTSEFLEARRRARIKATIEMMASLPSVVLGFLAALVIARFVEHALTTTIAAFALVPFCLLLGARLWQLLPQGLALRMSGLPRVAAIAVATAAGLLAAAALGGPLERALFSGRAHDGKEMADVRAWLADPKFGDAAGGLMVLLLPLAVFAVAVVSTLFVAPWLRRVSTGWSPLRCAGADLVRYLLAAAAAVGAAWLVAVLLADSGVDARAGFLGRYEQRNALIVGFVMGFAIVPIIYTLAEDALSSVPVALRAASLGAGATHWQTAFRVVIPTAMSGLFGALMVGLGRAVGETMIILMASGNTPIDQWNAFNGFRSLSANIAIEMMEAAKNGALYRTLFVTALVLFGMTFVVNTAAEMVRRRFRKRFAQL
jgi:phosphate transport system permease protein